MCTTYTSFESQCTVILAHCRDFAKLWISHATVLCCYSLYLPLLSPYIASMVHTCIYLLILFQVSDFLHCEGKVSLYREEVTTRQDSSLLSSLYSYWLLSNDQSGKALTPSEIKARKTTLECIQVQWYMYSMYSYVIVLCENVVRSVVLVPCPKLLAK